MVYNYCDDEQAEKMNDALIEAGETLNSTYCMDLKLANMTSNKGPIVLINNLTVPEYNGFMTTYVSRQFNTSAYTNNEMHYSA